MQRIETLRLEALKNKINYDEFFYHFYKCYAHSKEATMEEKYAEAFYYTFENMKPAVSDDELIVGKIENQLTAGQQKEWNDIYEPFFKKEMDKARYGKDSHMTVNYDLILNCGLNGIIKKIDTYMLNCPSEKTIFYQGCKKCLEAVIKHSENYADYLTNLCLKTDDPARKKEIETLAKICKKVPAQPAETFYEAVQSAHFVTYCLSMNPLRYGVQQFQLGHPDRYLLPFYTKDIKEGRITKEYAQLLLDCVGIQINNRVDRGFSSGYMVGGRDENNNIVANELTLMCMQVIDDIRLVYPAVGLCYTKGMDSMYLEKACEILAHGRTHPAIFNDDTITKGLKYYGVDKKEAHNYIHSTCVEITPSAASNAWAATPYTNMPQLLMDLFDREYDSFDELMNALYKSIDTKIKCDFEENENLRKVRSDASINPLLSCLVNDCLKRGLDIERGGAKYNWVMPSFVGMANLVDSLYVLKQLIFEEKEFTIGEFKEIIDNNYENYEPLRQRILNKIPKYGNDIDEVDNYFEEITSHIVLECKKYKGSLLPNADTVPGMFCFKRHVTFGAKMGATPDGRKSGFPLGDGSGPAQGREYNGPTASLNSSTKWKHHEFIGGVAVNIKLSKSLLGNKVIPLLKSIIEAYMERGGFELQINVTDNQILKEAIKNPDQYQDLLVRIGGYSDYFVRLDPAMQQELILRTEHNA